MCIYVGQFETAPMSEYKHLITAYEAAATSPAKKKLGINKSNKGLWPPGKQLVCVHVSQSERQRESARERGSCVCLYVCACYCVSMYVLLCVYVGVCMVSRAHQLTKSHMETAHTLTTLTYIHTPL